MLRYAGLVAALLLLARGTVADPPPVKLPPNFPPEAQNALAHVKLPPGAADALQDMVDPTARLPPELVPVWQISMQFFTAVLARDQEGAVAFSRTPFSFDGHPAATADEVKKGWARYLAQPAARRPVLYGLEVLPYEEMVKRYGPPPAKLVDAQLKSSVIAVANIDGRANLAIVHRDPNGLWRVYGYSD